MWSPRVVACRVASAWSAAVAIASAWIRIMSVRAVGVVPVRPVAVALEHSAVHGGHYLHTAQVVWRRRGH